MGWENPLVIIPFVLISLAALLLAGEAWHKRSTPGSMSFALLMLAVCVWLVASGGNLAATSHQHKLIWAKTAYLGISWVATLWLTFSIEFSYQHHRFFDRFGWVLWIVPMTVLLLVITNDLHHLYWTEIIYTSEGDLIFRRGIPFWVSLIYNYLLLLTGCGVLIRGLLRFPCYQRRQVGALILATLLPWLANISYIAGWLPQTELDLTPFTFSITGVIFSWILFRMRLFDPVPQARDAILEQMGEGYLAFDNRGYLLDCNNLARKMLNLGSAPVTGRHYREILAQWEGLSQLFTSQDCCQVELNTGKLVLEASLQTWSGKRRGSEGKILILYDITRRFTAENQLRESEERYRLLVNSIPVGIVTLDSAGRVLFASPEVGGLFGIKPGNSMEGTNLTDWIHAADRYNALEQIERIHLSREKNLATVYRMAKHDGQLFYGEITMTQMLGGGLSDGKIVAMIQDVTAQKELEQRLQRNLEQQTFINNLLQLVYHTQDMAQALQKALEMAGLFTRLNRIYVCQDSPDRLETTITAEWCSEGIFPRAREGPLLRYGLVPTLKHWLDTRGMVMIPADEDTHDFSPLDQDIPVDLAEFINAWSVSAFIAFPITIGEKHLHGFIGFDDCTGERRWRGEEIELLWNVTKIISGAVVQIEIEEIEKNHRLMTEALQDTAKALTSTLNLEEVLDRVLVNLEKVVQSDSASISLVDEEGMVSFVRWRGYTRDGEESMRQRMHVTDRDTFRLMSLTGEPVIVTDTWLDKLWRQQNAYTEIRSYAGAPIRVKGRLVGFLNLDSAAPDFFPVDVSTRLRVFADQAAVAIENARLYNLVHERAEQMSSLYRIGLSLTAGIEMNQVLTSLFEQCRQLLPIDVFYVMLYDPENDRLSHGIFYQDGEFLTLEPRILSKSPGVTAVVIKERRTVLIPDAFAADAVATYKLLHLGGTPARSYVAVPLVMLDEVVGVISMQNFKPFAFSAEQVRLLETIATQAAVAVQNARMYEQMRQMAITDSVTQLFTRRHFTLLGHNEVERSLRYQRSASVLMVDIDHFKRVNDTYGHFAGDLVLQAVAKTCSQALRVTDIVGRWGGEEFTIVLPEADRDGAWMIAERIRRMVEECAIPLADGRTIHVTVSLGIATINAVCCSLEVLVDMADKAMYAAKQAGRNQVKFFDEMPQSVNPKA